MRLFTFTDVVEHRGRTITVRAARGRLTHYVTVTCGNVRREFELSGRFGAELRNKAVEKFSGLESK